MLLEAWGIIDRGLLGSRQLHKAPSRPIAAATSAVRRASLVGATSGLDGAFWGSIFDDFRFLRRPSVADALNLGN